MTQHSTPNNLGDVSPETIPSSPESTIVPEGRVGCNGVAQLIEDFPQLRQPIELAEAYFVKKAFENFKLSDVQNPALDDPAVAAELKAPRPELGYEQHSLLKIINDDVRERCGLENETIAPKPTIVGRNVYTVQNQIESPSITKLKQELEQYAETEKPEDGIRIDLMNTDEHQTLISPEDKHLAKLPWSKDNHASHKVDTIGYKYLIKTADGKDKLQRVYLHRLVIEERLGRPLDRSEIITFRNGDPLDCRRGNLLYRRSYDRVNKQAIKSCIPRTRSRIPYSKYKMSLKHKTGYQIISPLSLRRITR